MFDRPNIIFRCKMFLSMLAAFGLTLLSSSINQRSATKAKGLHGWIANQSSDRLIQPLIRRNGQLKPAS